MEILIISILGAIILILIFLLVKKSKENEEFQKQLNYLNMQNAKNEEILKNFEEVKKELANMENEKENILNRKNELEKELAKTIQKLEILENIQQDYKILQEINAEDKARIKELETKLAENEKSFEEKFQILKKSEKELKETFDNLASKILETTQQKAEKNIIDLLNPLNKELKEFKEKIENMNEKGSLNINLLKKEIEDLKNLSLKLSDDANNLTKALKGEKKLQGSWGELVLERVLEMSGLRKGIEYEREVNLKNDENKTYRPDVIIHLPNERDVIIDSKVSLNSYSEYVKNNNETDLKNHIKALKNHIDTLAEKKYENLKGINSLDFIFMFVPVENALNIAIEKDNLFEYAFKKRVILVSPSTLLISLRAIEASWRYERQAENIKEIVKSAENLYDKVRGFLEDFKKVGENLYKAKDTYEKAKNKLSTGKGNVIRQIAILKEKAGIKPKKEIPDEFKTLANLGEKE